MSCNQSDTSDGSCLIKKTHEILFSENHLTDSIFETGAYGVPSKSQNPTVLGQSGSWYPMFKP
jgi:hypothetical protein